MPIVDPFDIHTTNTGIIDPFDAPKSAQLKIKDPFDTNLSASGTWGDPSLLDVIKTSLKHAPYSAAQGVGGLGRMLGEAVGGEKIADWGKDVYQGAGIEMQKDMPEIRGNVKRAVYGGVQSLSQNLPGMAASVVTGSPIPALASIGLLSGGQSYGESREKGVTPAKAAVGALGEGGLEVATEYVPIGYLLKPGLSLARRTLFSGLSELVGENINTVGQKAVQWWTRNPDKTVGEFVNELYPDARQTSLQVLMTTPVMALGAHAAHKAMPQPQPIEKQAIIDPFDKPPQIQQTEKQEVVLPPGEKPLIPSAQEPIKQLDISRNIIGYKEGTIGWKPNEKYINTEETVPIDKDVFTITTDLPLSERDLETIKARFNIQSPLELNPYGKQEPIFDLSISSRRNENNTYDYGLRISSRFLKYDKYVPGVKEILKKTLGIKEQPPVQPLPKPENVEIVKPPGERSILETPLEELTLKEMLGDEKGEQFEKLGYNAEQIRGMIPDSIRIISEKSLTPSMVDIKPTGVIRIKQPKGFTPIEAAPVYQPRGLKEAITIRKEMGSLAGYDLQSQTEWLGGQKPKGEITIYRATPTGEEIKPGDYVTNSLEYAKQHIQNNLGGKGIITKIKATLDDIFPADAPKEFWYAPKSIELQQTHTMPSGEVMPGAEHKETSKFSQPKMFEGEKADITPKMEADIQGQQKLFNPKGETELYAGLPIPSIIKSFAKLPGIEKIVGFFNPLKGLSPKADIAYQNIRNKEKGREARVQRFVMNQFDRLSEMPTETREQMFHALTSRESITKLPKEYWRKAESLRSLHKYMGQMAVKRGLLSPETYASNKGEWVKHLYEKYMQEKKDSLNKQQSSMTMQLDWKKRKLPDTSFGVDEQRARGLKEDVATAVPVGMTEVLTDLSRSDMFDEILNNSELTWQPSVVSVDNGQGGLETWSIGNLQKHIESQGQAVLRNPGNVAMKNELARLQGIMEQAQKESGNVPKGYTQLPSTPAYGKLAGAYVKDAVARDIMPALAMFGKGTSASEFYNAVQKVMTKGMATFKASKVALNLPSWFRNGGANVIMFNMKGTPLYEIPYWLEQSAVGMMKGTTEYTQAFRQGLFRTKYSDIEINNFLGTSRKLLGQDYSGITETLSGAANLYGKIDDWFKFAIYLEERRKGTDVATAVRQANKWGMDYSLVNPAVKIARQSLVPFASFNYKFVPLFVETAAQRPWIMAKYMAIPLIMLKAVQSMYDMTDEDVRKLVLSLPSYVRKQKTLLPLPHMSPEGNLEWVDIGYFLPWNTEIQAYKAIKEKDMGEMLRTIGIGNPFLDIYALAKSGHQENPPRNPYNGQEIYNRLDDLPTKLFKLLEYNYNLFAPGMATRYGAAGKIAEIGKKDKYGRTVTPLQAMLRFIGVNIIVPTKEQGRIEKVARIKELQSSLYKGFRDARGDKGKQKQLRESFKEKRRKILAGED